MNSDLVLDETLRAPHDSDWRGFVAAPRGSPVQRLASFVVKAAQALSRKVTHEEPRDVADADWMDGGRALAKLLNTTDMVKLYLWIFVNLNNE